MHNIYKYQSKRSVKLNNLKKQYNDEEAKLPLMQESCQECITYAVVTLQLHSIRATIVTRCNHTAYHTFLL